ncbi:unnamed protein product [Tenebrio molitor]|nr:unnamed protein product [Tenebrio molitor]
MINLVVESNVSRITDLETLLSQFYSKTVNYYIFFFYILSH